MIGMTLETRRLAAHRLFPTVSEETVSCEALFFSCHSNQVAAARLCLFQCHSNQVALQSKHVNVLAWQLTVSEESSPSMCGAAIGMNVKLMKARTSENILFAQFLPLLVTLSTHPLFLLPVFFPKKNRFFVVPFDGSCRGKSQGQGRGRCQGARRGVRIMVWTVPSAVSRASRRQSRLKIA